jgi:Flp pilus assembly protein TadB
MPLAVGAVFTWLKPEAMSMLWETPQGHQMVAATAVLSVVGYIVCRKVGMVRI